MKENFYDQAQFGYDAELKANINDRGEKMLKEQYNVSMADLSGTPTRGVINIALTKEQVPLLEGNAFFGPLTRQNHPKGYNGSGHVLPISQRDSTIGCEDNFGPIYIPQKGARYSWTESINTVTRISDLTRAIS